MAEGRKVTEFRGCKDLVYAEVTQDDDSAYVVGDVNPLAGVAEISRTFEQSIKTSYYDNLPKIVVQGRGADEMTFTVSVLDLKTLGDITSQTYDEETGALIGGATGAVKDFAVGYRLQHTDGTERLVWWLKGNFTRPEEASATQDDGTDTNNQSLVYTSVGTIYKFKNGGRATNVAVDTGDEKIDYSKFFDDVTTPDKLKPMLKMLVHGQQIKETTQTVKESAIQLQGKEGSTNVKA